MSAPGLLQKVQGGLIVSCQALENEPLHGSEMMAKMASAAQMGGAAGIRANTKEDIRAIRRQVNLPIIGIVKRNYPDSPVYITPTMREIEELVSVEAELLAMDATERIRPHGCTLAEFVQQIKERYPLQPLMADISTVEEAIEAEQLGFTCVSTTLIGYTEKTQGQKLYHQNFITLKEIVQNVSVPVIAEGNVRTPEEARQCLEIGAHAVVVGGAITRPQVITHRFVEEIQ